MSLEVKAMEFLIIMHLVDCDEEIDMNSWNYICHKVVNTYKDDKVWKW